MIDNCSTWFPFLSCVRRDQSGGTTTETSPLVCQRCFRLFDKFLKADTDERVSQKRRRATDEEKRRFLSRRKKKIEELMGEKDEPTCYFMAGKGTFSCSTDTQKNYHPTRLKTRSTNVQQRWCYLFAEKNDVSVGIAKDIASNADKVKLCTVHTGELKSCLLKAQSEGLVCSVCNELGTARHPKEVTAFPWNRLRKDVNNVCVIEDALAVFKGSSIRPSDIRYICSSCRKVIYRDLDMKQGLPRDQTETVRPKERKARFNYGPTPMAVRRCIMFVKNELEKEGNFVVFLRSVREHYESIVGLTGEERFKLKDDRSLKKYLQPSLAASGIHLMMGAQKVGSFFCTSKKFIQLAAKAKQPSKARLALTPDAEGDLYDTFGEYIKSRKDEVSRSVWTLAEFIRAVPPILWWRTVELSWGPQLRRRCHSIASLRGTPYNEQWPCNPLFCPEEAKALPNHEFTLIISVYYSVERMVFNRSSRRTRGPIVTSLSLVALTNTSVAYLSLLNRLGCATSYQLLDGWRKIVIAERRRCGPFQELVITAFMVVGIDNLNLRASHSLNVHGMTYNGFDGLAMQAVNSNPSFDFEAYCSFLANSEPAKLLPKEISMPSNPLAPSRLKFIEDNFPSRTEDPDIVGFKYLTVGLAAVNQHRIATEDKSQQTSFRRIVLDALMGATGGKARVEYVDVRGCNASDVYEVIRLLESIEEHFNPFGAGRLTLIAVEGDQPIFKILFKLWMASMVTGSKLAKWMIPIPGGFHIDKQALIDMIKIFLSGSGLEEFVQFTGLPKKKQEAIMSYGHFRKNQRLLSQYTAAALLRLIEVLADCDPDLREFLRVAKQDIERELNLKPSEREKIYKDKNRGAQIKAALPAGCVLEVEESVSPKVIEIGRRVVEAVKKMAEVSVNMKFFAEFQLLDMLVPWTAYNLLTRKAMTSIVDKFWLSFVGVLHVTNKRNYQENILVYAVVKAAMPEAARHVLYEKGHLVMSLHETSTESSLAQDDGVESKIIRDTKRMNTNDRKVVESSPPVAMALGRAQTSIDKELHPAVRSELIENENETTEPRKKRDREAKTALNVLKMLEFLRSRRWLGEEHRRRPEVINVLREPWFVVSDKSFFEQYVNSERTGRVAASLHLGAKFYDFFPTLTKEELKEYFDDRPQKSVQGKWTKKFVFKTMTDMEPLGPGVGSKRGRSAKAKTEKRMTKRMKTFFSVKGSLNDIIHSTDTNTPDSATDTARVILKEVEENDHLLTPKAFAYRADLSSDQPFRGRDGFLSVLQSVLAQNGFLTEHGHFLRRGIPPTSPPIMVSHLDITAEVKLSPSIKMQRTAIGEAVYDKVEKFVEPFVKSAVRRNVQEPHIHVDTTEMIPLQHPFATTEEPPVPQTTTDVYFSDEEGESFSGACQTWTSMKQTWSAIVSNPRNHKFLQHLHAVCAAKAAVLMRNQRDDDTRDNETRRQVSEELVVFLHGTAIAITGEAQHSSLSEVDFVRIEDKVLITKKSAEALFHGRVDLSRLGEELLGVKGYGPECCWKVTELGFERFPAGDCAHGESQTRVIHPIAQVTIPRMSNSNLPYTDWTVSVRSCHPESALIGAVSSLEEELNLIYQIDESFVDVRAMRQAFKAANIRTEDVVLLYAMYGCALTASTQQIPQKLYIDAFFGSGLQKAHKSLYCLEISSMPGIRSEHWLRFEELVAAAYVLKYRKQVGRVAPRFNDRTESDLDGTEPLDSEGYQWVSQVRKWVAGHGDVMVPNELMPESSDVELQSRRAVWVLRYRQSSGNYECHKNTVGGLTDESGYTKNGDILFERSEEVARREQILKKVVQTCSCRGGRNNKRCSCCRKTPPSLCVLCDCENCQNRGKMRAVHLETLKASQEEESEESDAEDSSDEEEDSDDDSILG